MKHPDRCVCGCLYIGGICCGCEKPYRVYPELDPMQLEPHFSRHMLAMTAENLHDKSAIAEQLAWRDQVIEESQAELALLRPQALLRPPVVAPHVTGPSVGPSWPKEPKTRDRQ